MADLPQPTGAPIEQWQRELDGFFQYIPKSPAIEEIRTAYREGDMKAQAQAELDRSRAERNQTAYSEYALGTPVEAIEKPSFRAKNYNVDELYQTLSTGEQVTRFDTYTPGIDNMEAFAKSQSNWDKWTNGATKAIAQTASGVVGGTIGTIYGIGAAINQGSFAATYDNDFANYLDNLNEKLKYELPNYQTKAEQQMSYGERLGTANFWADDVLGGLAFTASAIATELIWAEVTGGTSLATTGARLGRRAGEAVGVLGKAGRVAEEAAHIVTSSVDDIVKNASKVKTAMVKPMADATRNTLLATKGTVIGGRIGEGANLLRSMYTGAGYESGFEARTYMREMRENFEADWTKAHGTPPTEEDKAEFEINLANSANGLYAYNLAIVGSSNVAMFGSLVGVTKPKIFGHSGEWLNKNIFGSGVRAVEGEGLKAITASKLQKVGQYAYSLGKGAVMEGAWEEGMQAVGQNTAKNLMYDSYNQKFANASYDIAKGFGNALNKTYGTSEGLEEVFTGMIIGGLTGSAIGLRNHKTLNHEFTNSNLRAKNIEEQFGQNATYSSKVAVENLLMSNVAIASKQAEENAIRRGDLLGGQLSRNTTIFKQLRRADVLDYFDQTVDSMHKEIDLIDEESLMKEHSLTKDQAVELKQSMKDEYISQAKAFKQANDFANYFVGNKVTKQERQEVEDYLIKNRKYSPERAKEEAKSITTDMLSQSLAYEMYLGTVAHNFSSEMLSAFQNETQNILGQSNTKTAFTIHDVLNKSSKETKAKSVAAQKALETASKEFTAIETKYRQVENILMKATTPEARQKIQGQLSDLLLEKEQQQKEVERLEKEFNVLYNAAKLENPLGKDNTEEFIPREDILNVDNAIKNTLEAIQKYKTTNPIQGERLEKLLMEYEKSVGAFKKYSERTQQIMTEGIGLRGKRNMFTELVKDKTPTEATIKMIQGLMDTHFEAFDASKKGLEEVAQEIEKQQRVEEEGGIPAIVMEAVAPNPNQAEIDRLEAEKAQKQAELETAEDKTPIEEDIKKIDTQLRKLKKPTVELEARDYIISQIKNHPYMFHVIEEDYQQALPTEEEIDEYYDLAEKDLVEQQPLTPEEIARFEALNIKMANWQLLEAIGAEGTSIADMIQQDVLNTKEVKPTEEEEFNEEDVEKTLENGFDSASPRPMSVLQTVQNVFVQKFKNAPYTYISHMTPKLFLESIGQGNTEVEYYMTKKDKDGKDVVDGEITKINAQNINEVAKPNMVIIFGNTKIALTEGMRIRTNTSDFDSFGFRTRMTKSGYSMMFDQEGKAMKSDFENIDTYSPQEIYRLNRGTTLIAKVDMNDPYNQSLTEEELEKNLKIDLYDENGAKVGTLKAQHSTDEADSSFLDIRLQAVELFRNADILQESIEVGSVDVEHIFLGSPNLQLDENNKERLFPIIPEQVETYGVWDGNALKTKEKIAGVRTDLLKGINKALPIVIMKEGGTSVAYPISLIKVDSMLGTTIVNSGITPAQMVIQLKEALIKNGKPLTSAYYYSDSNNNILNEDGSHTEEFDALIKTVNEIQQKVDYKTEWLKPTHTINDLVNEAQINIDMNQPKLLSPKIAVDLNSFVPSQLDTMTEEEITETVTNLFNLRQNQAKFAVKVKSADEIEVVGNTPWAVAKGSYKYIVHPISGDVIFIQKVGTKNAKILGDLLKMNEVELQSEIDRVKRSKTGNVFVKTAGQMDNFNSNINKIVELENIIESNPKLLQKYEQMFGKFNKSNQTKTLTKC